MADLIYNKFPEFLAKGDHDFDAHTFKLALLCADKTPAAVDETYAPASVEPGTYEVGGINDPNAGSMVGYTAGGKAITSLTVTHPSAGVTKITGVIAAWTGATFTTRGGFIYNDSTSPKRLVMAFDFGANKSVTAGTFQLTANADGFFTMP